MIINVQNKKDTITVDIRCRQIRYMKGAASAQGPILFYDMTQTDADCYEFLHRENKTSFLNALAEDVTNNMHVKPVKASNLVIQEVPDGK
jgi:hypothetical protein